MVEGSAELRRHSYPDVNKFRKAKSDGFIRIGMLIDMDLHSYLFVAILDGKEKDAEKLQDRK